jgi:hypothetical protein
MEGCRLIAVPRLFSPSNILIHHITADQWIPSPLQLAILAFVLLSLLLGDGGFVNLKQSSNY